MGSVETPEPVKGERLNEGPNDRRGVHDTTLRMYAKTHIVICKYLYVCMYVCTYVRMYVCMHICMYVYIYICIYCTYAYLLYSRPSFTHMKIQSTGTGRGVRQHSTEGVDAY